MSDMVVPELQALGFSDYEARAYVALLQRGALTGYQVAKASGIPRPNIYPLLDRLEQRGAVTRVESDGRVRYRAVPGSEMLRDLSRGFSSQLDRAEEALKKVGQPAQPESVRNLQGYDTVLNAAEGLITSARDQLVIAMASPESSRLASTLAKVHVRGVEITTLCIEGCDRECGDCQGRIYRYPIASDFDTRWLVIARDESELLIGQAAPGGAASAVLTSLEAIVAVGAQYVRNTVALAALVKDVGPRLDKLAGTAALQSLQTASQGPGGGWLQGLTRGNG